MSAWDVFNGDADGLCALQQLRLASPRAATLVTGVKRDIELLQRVPARAGDALAVLDISLDRNHAALARVLDAGASVEWFDHHHAGAVPTHAAFAAHIDESPDTCTSLIVDRHLGGRHRAWAIVGAFGDNLRAQAERLADAMGLDRSTRDALREIGESLNYNAYGDAVADLLIAPDALHRAMRAYADPLHFASREPVVGELHRRRHEDLALALAVAPESATARVAVYRLPDAPWARRVGGTFAHHLAQLAPERAHAVLGPHRDGTWWASIRAPLARPRGAGTIARRFATGGGREGAAGIEHLPHAAVPELARALHEAFGNPDH
jgi:hypothetical protein